MEGERDGRRDGGTEGEEGRNGEGKKGNGQREDMWEGGGGSGCGGEARKSRKNCLSDEEKNL